MPGSYNQCPTASGVFGSRKCRGGAIDLVHWPESESHARPIESKWLRQPFSQCLVDKVLDRVLRYDVLYIFCRVQRRELPLHDRPSMDARRMDLEIVAPARFYVGPDRSDLIARMNEELGALVRSKIGDTLSMSLNALAFPPEFDRTPFSTGGRAAKMCNTAELTDGARRIRDAFGASRPVRPSR